MSEVVVSVVVPCRDEERFVAACLDSLRSQTLPAERYEVLFVDNGSTDASLAIARDRPWATVLEEPRRGSYAARNTGVRGSRGRLLAFTDADCSPQPDWLERMEAGLAEAAVVLGARRFGSERFAVRALADYETEKARWVFGQDDASLYYGYTNNMGVRRDVFDRCGPFPEIDRGGDVAFVSRVTAEEGCDAVRFLPDLVVRHHEIERWHHWPRKMWLYGSSYERYRARSGTRPLPYGARFEIVRRTLERRGDSVLGGAFLLLSGFAATLAYGAGRWRARLARRGGSALEGSSATRR